MHMSPPYPGSLGCCPLSGCGSVVDLLRSSHCLWGFVLACITLCPYYVCNHLDEEERAACFAFGCLATLNVLWLFLTVQWVGLLCVILVYPDHIHLLFYQTCQGFSWE